MRDSHFFTRDHALAAEVIYTGRHRDVTPVVERLGDRFGQVATRQYYPRPYAGSTSGPGWDFVETVTLVITAAGGAEFTRRIIGSLADDVYRALRRSLLRFGRRRLEWRRIKRAVIIRVGSHRFAFDQSISDRQFRHQLKAAQALVERGPVHLLEPEDPDDEWTPWLWDDSERKWRTSAVRLAQAVGEEPRRVG